MFIIYKLILNFIIDNHAGFSGPLNSKNHKIKILIFYSLDCGQKNTSIV